MKLDPAHVEWCRRHFDWMQDGAHWGMPRCGLLFFKRGTALVLEATFPYRHGRKFEPSRLNQLQIGEYELTKTHFEAAGIRVRQASKLVDGSDYMNIGRYGMGAGH